MLNSPPPSIFMDASISLNITKMTLLAIAFALLLSAIIPCTTFSDTDAVTDSGICGDNLRWNYTNGRLTISGTGDMYDFEKYNESPWYKYRYDITELIFPEGITSIGNYAFHLCASKSINIPDSIKKVGTQAFYSSTVESLKIGSGLEYIGDEAFKYCNHLTYIEYNGNVTEVPKDAFTLAGDGGDGLYLIIGDGVSSIPKSMFRGISAIDIVIGKSVQRIGDAAFYGCDMVEKITFNGHVLESIGEAAFDLKGNSRYAVFCEVFSSYDEGFLDTSSRGNVSFTYTKVMPSTTHKVTFVTNCPTSLEPMTVYDGFPVQPDISYYGYFLEGWYIDSKFTKSFDILGPVTSDITLYAHWIPATLCTVTFETNGGEAMAPIQEYSGVKLSELVKDPSRGNFTFNGWFVDKGLRIPLKENQLLTEDITLYAGWIQPSEVNVPYLAIAVTIMVLLLVALAVTVIKSNDSSVLQTYFGVYGMASLGLVVLIAIYQLNNGAYFIDVAFTALITYLLIMFAVVICPLFMGIPGAIIGGILCVIGSIFMLQDAIRTDELLDYMKIAWPILGIPAIYGFWDSHTYSPNFSGGSGGSSSSGGSGGGSSERTSADVFYPDVIASFDEQNRKKFYRSMSSNKRDADLNYYLDRKNRERKE